ncbi:hypothetical protein [Mucilaginibacter ginsenosidivorans]|uniref:Uncharacterized protein n=1 Tax=Mucilaginibacter ginsenosidivorans TaxID=398053 RepID=A0A5B8UTG0_9SPHI|nr:hypothetical protein [Mucilaginibacter ginsenosidivorans]QEC62188.1 hypothetical protein FRZ54_06180 [Mucilaginibacter ginsenosidivorans]
MKKLLISLMLILPLIASAQEEEPPLYKDFFKDIRSLEPSLVINDHLNIMSVNTDNENFSLTAINDQVQSVWQSSLPGYVITVRKFNGKILAVAASEFSKIKQTNNTFKAYILDPATGKTLAEKVIFDGVQDHMAFPFVFTGDGDTFKLAVRESGFERRLHVAMPSLLGIVSMNSYIKQFNETKNLDVIDVNDKLEVVNKIKPVIGPGIFIGLTANNAGDLFVAWDNNGKMDITKYDKGKATPAKTITGDVILGDDALDSFGGNDIVIRASKNNNNILYYSLVFRNPDKETELGIGRLDFSTGAKKYVNELFTKDHVKAMKKSFVPVNKKMDSPDLGSVKSLNLRSFGESDNGLIAALTSTATSSGMNGGTWETENSIVVNGYDLDLTPKFQQLIPTGYTIPNRHLPLGFYFNKSSLYIISNDKRGMTTLNGTYSMINFATGKCEKMYWLSKKKIGNSHPAASHAVLWFANSFVVPYMDMKGITGSRYDITLQQNAY